MKQQNQNFLKIVDKDSEGNVGGIVYLTRESIHRVVYNAIQDVLQVFLTTPITKTEVVAERLLNKQNEFTNAYTKGVASMTEAMQVVFEDHGVIIEIINFFTGSDYTIENYEGFQFHNELREKFKKAKAKKEAEEKNKDQIKTLQDEIRRRKNLDLDFSKEQAELDLLLTPEEEPKTEEATTTLPEDLTGSN